MGKRKPWQIFSRSYGYEDKSFDTDRRQQHSDPQELDDVDEVESTVVGPDDGGAV